MGDFVHLHLRSEYSFLSSVCRAARMPEYALAKGQRAVALTDTGVMYGMVKFVSACAEKGIKPIIGCEINSRSASAPDGVLVLLCKNAVGYSNLLKIVSSMTEGETPIAELEYIKENSEGLICLSGGKRGAVTSLVSGAREAEGEKLAVELAGAFKERFFIELQSDGTDADREINKKLISLAKKHSYGTVATDEALYYSEEDYEIYRIVEKIGGNKTAQSQNRYFKSTEEMEKLFDYCPEAVENSAVIADSCSFELEFNKKHFPKYSLPEGVSAKETLASLAKEGLEKKIKEGLISSVEEENGFDEYKSRMIYELLIINHMGYDDYFLIVRDFVIYAKEHSIPVGPGRGSGAGSLVAFLIGITEVDPVKYHLLFERFLNPERVSMPDFDIDFCYERRDEVIDYVSEKYGSDRVCRIVTFGTLAARAAVGEVSKAMGMAEAGQKILSLIPKIGAGTLREMVEGELGEIYKKSADAKKIIDASIMVEGIPKYASTHASGVIIAAKDISEDLPLAKLSGVTVSQYDMDSVAKLGLLKFDFLALRNLTIIDECVKKINATGEDFSLGKVDYTDSETYDMLSSGLSAGVFQLESAGMKKLLTSLRPRSIEDIMICLALYRPGPRDSIPKFLSNRQKKNITYSIPVLADILDETSGCIVYQEQVMQIFRKVANYSYGKADVIRRIMAKKKKGEIEKHRADFVSGAVKNHIPAADAEKLFDEMNSFASYAFNKSHAAAYSLIAFRTAYLKRHYPAQYLSSLLSSLSSGSEKIAEYLDECRSLGIGILGPDINRSGENFSLEGDSLRFSLPGIRGVGFSFASEVVKERENGEYKSFTDFARRIKAQEFNKKTAQALIKAGCFDSLGTNRASLMAVCDTIVDSSRTKLGGVEGQQDFFSSSESAEVKIPNVGEYDPETLETYEREECGYSFFNSKAKVKAERQASEPRPGEGERESQKSAKKILFVRVKGKDSHEKARAESLIEIFEGTTEAYFYFSDTGKYEKAPTGCALDGILYKELCELLGEDNVIIK